MTNNQLFFTFVILLSFTAVGANDDYFTYSDCDDTCKQKKLCCTITEVSSDYFPCMCSRDQEQCEALASEFTVCLQPDRPAIGGQTIWPDFKRHFAPTEPPPPSNQDECRNLIALVIFLSITNFIGYFYWIVQFIRRRKQNSSRERLLDEDDPYQETVEQIPE